MGLEEPALYDSDEEIARQVLGSGHRSLDGITLEALKASGSIRLSYPDPFVPFAEGFPTASRRLEFVSEWMARASLDPVAGYTPSFETAQRDTRLALEYPLALITPANQCHRRRAGLGHGRRGRVSRQSRPRRESVSRDRVDTDVTYLEIYSPSRGAGCCYLPSLKISRTATASRFHVSFSTASCFCPAFVSE